MKFDKLTEAYMKVIENTDSDEDSLNVKVIKFNGKKDNYSFYTVSINGKTFYVRDFNLDPKYTQVYLKPDDLSPFGKGLGEAQYRVFFNHSKNFVDSAIIDAINK